MKIALDRSARTIDQDGRLHVERSHISKAAINPYFGEEIPDWQNLGLDPKKIYRLYRDPEELAKSASTFNRLPILSKHIPVTVDSYQPDYIVGAIGSDVSFTSPYLDASICLWDAKAIAGIESGQVQELSCGYRYTVDMNSGSVDGKNYDGRMTNIRGNHLALVETGRAGPDVMVADSNPFLTVEKFIMKFNQLGAAFKKRLMALDASLEPEQMDNIIDALLDVEQDPKPTDIQSVSDGTPEEKVKALLAGKVEDSVIEEICKLIAPQAAADAESGEPAKEEATEEKPNLKGAMDSMRAELVAQFRDANEARLDVRTVVGDVRNVDTAAEIYGFALDQMSIDRKGVEEVAGLRALFKAASNKKVEAPRIATDSAALAKSFPNATRFTKA